MSIWLTESEFRQSGAAAMGVTLNHAFLADIKDDHVELRELVKLNRNRLGDQPVEPSQTLAWLNELRDELETYFALEEFYGYFNHAAISNPSVSRSAKSLKTDHEKLFIQLIELIDQTEQIIYHESDSNIDSVRIGFLQFASDFDEHEEAEMELMMRLCNEELGVGD